MRMGLSKVFLMALGKQESMLFIFESNFSIVGESLVCLHISPLIKHRVLNSTKE